MLYSYRDVQYLETPPPDAVGSEIELRMAVVVPPYYPTSTTGNNGISYSTV